MGDIYIKINQNLTGRRIMLVLGSILAIILLANSMYTVEAGHRVVVKRWNETHREASPGLNWKIPFVETLVKFDVKQLIEELEIDIGTKDTLRVLVKLGFNWRTDPDRLTEIVNGLGRAEDFTRINVIPRIISAAKRVLGQHSASDLNQNRGALSKQIEAQLHAQLDNLPVIVTRFYLGNFSFPGKYREAINAKEVAKQEVETARSELLIHEVTKQQQVLKANAENKAAKMLADAKLYADRQKAKGLDAKAAAIKKYPLVICEQRILGWDGILPKAALDGGGFEFLTQGCRLR